MDNQLTNIGIVRESRNDENRTPLVPEHIKKYKESNPNVNFIIQPSNSRCFSDEEYELWFGFRPMSPDGLPFIGETKISGLYLNTGQGHLGWTLAMGSADLCSDIVLENKTAIDPHPYRITR